MFFPTKGMERAMWFEEGMLRAMTRNTAETDEPSLHRIVGRTPDCGREQCQPGNTRASGSVMSTRHIEFLARPPQDPHREPLPQYGQTELRDILCVESMRIVGKDNVVDIDGIALQIPAAKL
jgi:hypothetical protein